MQKANFVVRDKDGNASWYTFDNLGLSKEQQQQLAKQIQSNFSLELVN